MEQPKIPTLKDSQKPQVKIKGIQAGLTLLDRLKQFKKKDLAFILAGLGTLFMAPLAEHFMMSPESGDATLQQGWGGGKGAGNNLFGSGASPYEPGTSGTAPGSAIGGGADVITPLNVRDPSALVMGPGASQQPPTNSAAPVTAPPSARSEPDLKDALAGAAARAASAAVKKAPLPVPKMALGGSGLRGLGVAGGGSSASGGLGAISSNGLASGKADTGGGLGNVRSAPNYRGVGTRGPNNANGGALEALKAAAAKAGEAMNRGSASSGLAEAAAQQMPTGGAGFSGAGSGAMGSGDKGPGGNAGKDSKSVGESLDFINKKSRMEKELELEFEKRKKQEMFWPDLMRDAQKELFMKGLIGPAAECMGGVLKAGSISKSKCFAPASTGYWSCSKPNANGQGTTNMPQADLCDTKGKKEDMRNCWDDSNKIYYNAGGNEDKAVTCTAFDGAKGSGDAAPPREGEDGVSTGPGAIAGPRGNEGSGIAKIKSACARLKEAEANFNAMDGTSAANATEKAERLEGARAIMAEVAKLAAARDALYAGSSDDCGNQTNGVAILKGGGVFSSGDKTARAQLDISFTKLGTVSETAAVNGVKRTASSVKVSEAKSATGDIKEQVKAAEDARVAALALIGADDKSGAWGKIADAKVESFAENKLMKKLRASPDQKDKADADLYDSIKEAKTALDAVRQRQFELAKDEKGKEGPLKIVVEGAYDAASADNHKDTLNKLVKVAEDNAKVADDAKKLDITPAAAKLLEVQPQAYTTVAAAGEGAQGVLTAIGTAEDRDKAAGAVKFAQTVVPKYAEVKDAPTAIKTAATGGSTPPAVPLTLTEPTQGKPIEPGGAKPLVEAANGAITKYKALTPDAQSKEKLATEEIINKGLQAVADLKFTTQRAVDQAQQKVADAEVTQKTVADSLSMTVQGAKQQQQQAQ